MATLKKSRDLGITLLLAAAACVAAPLVCRGDQMLSIEWKRGPNLPRGFQDSAGGIVANTLVTACGYCAGAMPNREELEALKPGVYPYGFMNKVWGLNLGDANARWTSLPDFPGANRQGGFASVVNDKLYCWGGYTYSTPPYTYSDGYCLSCQNNQWSWSPLPKLPWRLQFAGVCSIGSQIYAVGGGDHDTKDTYFHSDRDGNIPRLGARLLVFDTDKPNADWKELAACPGTPRNGGAAANVNGKLYFIAGATSDPKTNSPRGAVDNWKYDPDTNSWEQLPDMPVSSGAFPTGPIVAFDRYILLVGGYQFGKVLKPDGSEAPDYGQPTKHYPDIIYNSDIFVYDTLLNKFGTATPLPLNNFYPMTVVEGNRIHLLGGETGGSVIDGEPYGHHPELYLVGTISEVPDLKPLKTEN